ncbi:SpoIIE family protein phosphatase [Streptomyces avicenniae]|uniref:SpoIIE family protein phosphatase n=1 Tax=Streptomyces avicenniae TaxID=500153 RepID=UPI00069B76F5|nr:SpoIIE family protein phosphatase [Streptomyces avicenniae]
MSAQPSEPSGRDAAVPEQAGPRSPLDHLPVGPVTLDPRGTLLLWSPPAEDLLGWTARQATGRPLAAFLPPGHPAGHGTAALRALLRDGMWHGVLPLRHQDGRTVEAAVRAWLAREADGTLRVLADLTPTTGLGALERDVAALDALFTASPMGIALFDTEQRCTRVNEALTRLYGMSADELIGHTVLEVLPAPMGQELHRIQRAVLRTGQPITDLVTASPDGQGAQSVSFGRLTDPAGRPLGVSCTVLDISERRAALADIERSRRRLALLDDVGTALGDLLDLRRIGEALALTLVPRFADYAGVELLMPVATGGEPPTAMESAATELVQIGVAAKRHDATVDRCLGIGLEDLSFRPGSVLSQVLTTGAPHLAETRDQLRAAVATDAPLADAVADLGIHSMLTVPLRARGTVLGLLVVSRAGERAGFDREDLALALELAARAGISLDNARLYVREREGALTLQRSLLPQSFPSQPGVEVSHRYVPGSIGAEVGGDWFDAIPLTGGRVAFVMGDVTGHGLRAAALMGQLRTAVRTLAGLDLAPGQLLRRLNQLGRDIAERPDDPVMATCLYSVYDPATGVLVLAKAGHLPPVLAGTDAATGHGTSRVLDMPSGAPLGVDGVPFEELRVDVAPGSVLALYTDGLVETRDEDITDRVARLADLLAGATGRDVPLDDICDRVIRELRPRDDGREADDLALLLARLSTLPADRVDSDVFAAGPDTVDAARRRARATLSAWGLDALADRTERLVAELIGNAVGAARESVALRMVHSAMLLVEVTDPSPDPLRETASVLDDDARHGLPLISAESHRWGTREGPIGRTIWFELALPDR